MPYTSLVSSLHGCKVVISQVSIQKQCQPPNKISVIGNHNNHSGPGPRGSYDYHTQSLCAILQPSVKAIRQQEQKVKR
eukprot:1161898-Pelagomonas_calceolata.AAC.1